MKTVCILLINYNGSRDTIDCIKSIEKLSVSNLNIKVVIVDNNSAIDDYNQLEAYMIKNHYISLDKFSHKNKYNVIRNVKNIGFAAGNNKGIRLADEYFEVDYFLLLNNDTVMGISSLEQLVKAFDSLDVGAASGLVLDYKTKSRIWYAGGKISKLRAKGKHLHYNEDFNSVNLKTSQTDFLTGCYVMFTRDALYNIGLLNERFFFGTEEYDYSLKLKKLGYGMVFVPESVIYHKVEMDKGHGSSHQISDLIYIYNSMRNKYILTLCNSNWLYSKVWTLASKFYIKHLLLKRLKKRYKEVLLDENSIELLYHYYNGNLWKKYVDNKEFNEVRDKLQ